MGGRRSYKSNKIIGTGGKTTQNKKNLTKAIKKEDSKEIAIKATKAVLESELQIKELLDSLKEISNKIKKGKEESKTLKNIFSELKEKEEDLFSNKENLDFFNKIKTKVRRSKE